MRTYYTYFDSNYLIYGLALYNSLYQSSSEPFELYVLCLDDKAYNILTAINFNNIKLLKLSEIEKEDRLLQLAADKFDIKNNPSNYAHYCYSFSCWFTIYMMNNSSSMDFVYIDSDIYFYSDPKQIFDEMNQFGNKSVGITKHRHIGNFDCPHGYYNVGVMYFKNNETSKRIANWWFDSYVNKKHPELSTCGDQKYLEGFAKYFGDNNVHELDYIGHAAPWNFRFYQYDFFNENKIMWGREKQNLVYVHFSKFCPNFETQTYSCSDHHYSFETLNFEIYKINQVKTLYNSYFKVCLAIYNQLKQKTLI